LNLPAGGGIGAGSLAEQLNGLGVGGDGLLDVCCGNLFDPVQYKGRCCTPLSQSSHVRQKEELVSQ